MDDTKCCNCETWVEEGLFIAGELPLCFPCALGDPPAPSTGAAQATITEPTAPSPRDDGSVLTAGPPETDSTE